MNLIFGTSNQHKLEEVKSILDPLQINIKGLKDIGYTTDIEETGSTLEENASIKSWHVYKSEKVNVFSEDTGLEVEALNGAPGVYTARYAGMQKNHNDNMDLLLKNLSQFENRKAQFRAVISLILDGKESLFEGVIKGTISLTKRGEGGFGYDPIFIPEGYDRTFAELGEDIKIQLSHRARAVNKMLTYLQGL